MQYLHMQHYLPGPCILFDRFVVTDQTEAEILIAKKRFGRAGVIEFEVMDAFDMASVLKLEKRIGKKFTKVCFQPRFIEYCTNSYSSPFAGCCQAVTRCLNIWDDSVGSMHTCTSIQHHSTCDAHFMPKCASCKALVSRNSSNKARVRSLFTQRYTFKFHENHMSRYS
jgi:hypothetical protein